MCYNFNLTSRHDGLFGYLTFNLMTSINYWYSEKMNVSIITLTILWGTESITSGIIQFILKAEFILLLSVFELFWSVWLVFKSANMTLTAKHKITIDTKFITQFLMQSRKKTFTLLVLIGNYTQLKYMVYFY
jgi:hypothetical protein